MRDGFLLACVQPRQSMSAVAVTSVRWYLTWLEVDSDSFWVSANCFTYGLNLHTNLVGVTITNMSIWPVQYIVSWAQILGFDYRFIQYLSLKHLSPQIHVSGNILRWAWFRILTQFNCFIKLLADLTIPSIQAQLCFLTFNLLD